MINRVKLESSLNANNLIESCSRFLQNQNLNQVKLDFFKTGNLASSSNDYTLTVSSLSQLSTFHFLAKKYIYI